MADEALAAPASLLNARRLYKQSTAVVIDWLATSAGADPDQKKKKNKNGKWKVPKPKGVGRDGEARTMTINDILSFADRISKRQLTAPGYVHGAFRTALINRRRMTAWYRKNELGTDTEDTRRHEFFTETLDKAYSALCGGRPQAAVEKPDSEAVESPETVFANSFGPLEDLPTDKGTSLTDAELQEHLNSWAELNSKPQSRIIDDPFDEVFPLHRYVLEMDYMAAVVKRYWTMVAKGEMSPALAGWLTTAGYHGIQKLCEAYQNVAGISTTDLLHRYTLKKSQIQIVSGKDLSHREAEQSGHNPEYKEFSSEYALLKALTPLVEWKFGKQIDEEGLRAIARDKPMDYIASPHQEKLEKMSLDMMSMKIISKPREIELPEDEENQLREVVNKQQARDIRCMNSIIRSIIQIADNPHKIIDEDAEAMRNPMQHEVMHYLRHDLLSKDILNPKVMEKELKRVPNTEVPFGLMLLLETGKSFFYINNQPNNTDLTRRTHNLAKEVRDHMKRLVDGEHDAGFNRNMQPATIYALDAQHRELEEFTAKPRYDLYGQLPWTAGTQMSEILYTALDAGIGVCRTRDLLGQMLHIYNMVRQVAPTVTRALPFMEQLCDVFREQVFLGERPRKNFMNVLMRFMGGQFASEKGKDSRKTRFHIGAPKSVADGEKDNDRLKAYELSLFHDFRSTNPPFFGSGDFWAKVFTNRRVKKATTKQALALERQLQDVPFALTLERIRDAVIADFEGPFPIAKINWFKVYELAVEVLSELARRYQRKMPRELLFWQEQELFQPAPADACAGSSYVFVLAQYLDTFKDGRGYRAEGDAAVKLAADAFETVVGSKKVEDFFWKNV